MKKSTFLIPVFWCASTFSYAQETLADLIQIGAKKLSADDLRSVLVGANVTGPGQKNTQSDVTLHADGNASGYILAGGRSYALTGNYKITDDGKLCLHYEFMGGIPPYDRCVTYFLKDAQYYLAFSETDTKAQVVKRTFKK